MKYIACTLNKEGSRGEPLGIIEADTDDEMWELCKETYGHSKEDAAYIPETMFKYLAKSEKSDEIRKLCQEALKS